MLQSTTNPYDDRSDDRRAFVAAAARISRFDEALIRSSDLSSLHRSVAQRKEAVAIAASEGEACRPESLARLIGDVDSTYIERGAKAAFDIHQAIRSVSTWARLAPSEAEILDVFKTSEASRPRLLKPEMAWLLEEDVTFLADQLGRLIETPEPWLAAEVLRQIWISGRFFGTSRRIATLIAPWCIRVGFLCRNMMFGTGDALAKSGCDLREVENDPDAWAIAFAEVVAKASENQLALLDELMGLLATMSALCPCERSSSSVSAAINFFIACPISSAKRFSQDMGLSARGAKIVLDKMVSSKILDIEGGSRNRSYVCRRSL